MTDDEIYMAVRRGKVRSFAQFAAMLAVHQALTEPPKPLPPTLIIDSYKQDCPDIDVRPHRRWVPPTVRERRRH